MLRNYLTIAVRNLLRHKGYSAINIIGLAVGMACCILILLFSQHELSYDRFHKRADRIFRVIRKSQDRTVTGFFNNNTSGPLGPALQREFPEIEQAVRIRRDRWLSIRRGERKFANHWFCMADANIFDVFTFPLVEGDPKTALQGPFSVLITEKIAQSYFKDESPIGKVITIESLKFKGDYTITGILKDIPENATLTFDFLSVQKEDKWWGGWTSAPWAIETYLLLREGASLSTLESKLSDFVARHKNEQTKMLINYHLQPLTRIHLYSEVDYGIQSLGNIYHIYLFSLIALFILVIACINFMNLATAQSAGRSKEVGIRKVVGAHRRQLIQQFLGESLVFSILALVLALGLVELSLPRFNAFTGKHLNLFENVSAYLMLLGIALFAGLLAGCYPAFFLSAFKPIQVLKGKMTAGPKSSRFRKGLVVFQFSISIGLIISTITVYNQVRYLNSKHLGYEKENVVIVRVFTTAPPLRGQYKTIKHAFLQHSNVLKATVFQGRLGWGPYESEVVRPEGKSGEERKMMSLAVDEDFLDTFGVELKAGRNFSDDPQGVLLNETAVRQLGWTDPIGKRFGWENQEGTVIGVVRDFHIRPLHQEIEPVFMVKSPARFWYLALKIRPGHFQETLDFLDKTWKQFISDYPLDWTFLTYGIWNRKYLAERQFSQIVSAFSYLAILVACLGLFGLASFTAEQRTKEIGIRKVLGASVSNIVMLLSREFVLLVGIANLIAWPVAYYALSQWLQNFAYRIALGPGMFILGGMLALVIALVTVSAQAIKAARANPIDALRYE